MKDTIGSKRAYNPFSNQILLMISPQKTFRSSYVTQLNFDQNLTTQCTWNIRLVLFLSWLNAREFSSITKLQIRGTTRIYGLPQSQSFPSYRIYLHALNCIGSDRVEDMTLTVCTNNFFYFFWKMIIEPEKGCLRISLTWQSGTRSSARYGLKKNVQTIS